jgi:hypothetical protein
VAWRVLTAVFVVAVAAGGAPGDARAAAAWQDCDALIVENGQMRIVPSVAIVTGEERDRAPRETTALFIKVRHGRCATAWSLVRAVVTAPDESTALAAHGFRVRSVRGLGALPYLGPAYRLRASRRRTYVRYVRLGRLAFGGGLGARANDGPWPRDRAGCRRNEIIGVRGSGEGYVGPFGMADTVGATAGALVGALPRRSVRTTSLRYPAAPVSELLVNSGEGFFLSMEVGTRALVRRVRHIVGRCERSRIALIGYSQGAAVVSEALRRMVAGDLGHRMGDAIRAVVLYADPYSAGGNSSYALTFTAAGGPGSVRLGHGALGSRTFPLGIRLDRVRDVCFVADLVCDLPAGVAGQLVSALYAPVHSGYKDCCRGFPLTRLLGRRAARLMGRP